MCSAQYGCFLQFLDFVASWYVAHVFSKCLSNSPSRPYYYRYHLCFIIIIIIKHDVNIAKALAVLQWAAAHRLITRDLNLHFHYNSIRRAWTGTVCCYYRLGGPKENRYSGHPQGNAKHELRYLFVAARRIPASADFVSVSLCFYLTPPPPPPSVTCT